MKRLGLILLMTMMIVSSGICADEWNKAIPLDADAKIDFPTDNQANNEAQDRLLGDYRASMRLNYSSEATISVSSGQVACSNSAETLRRYRNNTSSTNVTFSDIDTGGEASGTTYYVYGVCDADAETATFLVSLSSSAPTGGTYYKRLGSFLNDGSSNISLIDNDNEEWEFGEKVSRTEGTTFQASTDGLVTAFVVPNANLGTAKGYTDSNSAPTELVCSVGAGPDQTTMSFTMPVKQGDYYKVVMENDGASSKIYFFPKQ